MCCQAKCGRDIQKFSQKGAWLGSRDPLNFWGLNANNSKTVKATDFKFGTNIPRDSPNKTEKFFQKGAWPRSRDTLIFFGVKC